MFGGEMSAPQMEAVADTCVSYPVPKPPSSLRAEHLKKIGSGIPSPRLMSYDELKPITTVLFLTLPASLEGRSDTSEIYGT